MSRVPTVRKADLDRVIAALARAGQDVARVEVKPGGVVVITPAPAAVVVSQVAPVLTVVGAGEKPADLDGWRERKKQRGDRASQGS